MISTFQAALRNAVDVVAPPTSQLEEFTYHWKQLMNFYVNHLTNCKVPIETTNIPRHLDQLLEILLAEETRVGSVNPGPCLEYLLQHRLLDLLATLACAETPPGMRLVCLSFLRKLLTRLRYPLLPHVSVYTPVQRLISLCNGNLASPIENEEIQFLVALCFLICKHPNLTHIMNNVKESVQRQDSEAQSSSNKVEIQRITYAPTRKRINSNPLFEPLNTQAVTLVTPSLHNTERQRKTSSQSSQSSQGDEFYVIGQSLVGESVREKDETTIFVRGMSTKDSRKVMDRSNVSLSFVDAEGTTDSSCLPLKKLTTDHRSSENFTILIDQDDKNPRKTSNGSTQSVQEIETKLQDLRNLRIDPKNIPLFTDPATDLDRALPSHKIIEQISRTAKADFDSNSDPGSYGKSSQGFLDMPSPSRSSKCLLLDALISYLNSADNMVRVKACEGIMVLASLQDSLFARSVAKSDLPAALSRRLESLFNSIPAHVDPNEIDEVNTTWGLDSPLWTNDNKFPGCRQVAAFFIWLDYCDQLTREAHPIVGETLAESIRVMFLERVLTPALTNHHVVLITALITKCLKEINAPLLNTEVSYWLVGHHRDPEVPGLLTLPVVNQLIENCRLESDELILETLRLFEQMIEKRNEHILHCLVLTYLTSRGYYDNSAADSAIASWSDEEDEREKRGTLDPSTMQNRSRTLAPSNFHRIINCFLSLLPRQLQTDSDVNNYEQYMADWEKQYATILADCALLAWPLEAVSLDDSASSDSRPEADHCPLRFSPGPFLTMLFEKVSKIPEQRYEINLQLTVLISRLALLPHPYLHEFLLNPLLSLAPGVRSLFACLQQVVKHLMAEVPKTHNYKEILRETRQRLLEDSIQNQTKQNILFESVVIMEEFCKELAAISYVKYHRSG